MPFAAPHARTRRESDARVTRGLRGVALAPRHPMKTTAISAALMVGVIASAAACVEPEQPQGVWQLPRLERGGLMYVVEGRAYIVANGHVYTTYQPSAEARELWELDPDPVAGAWKEVLPSEGSEPPIR